MTWRRTRIVKGGSVGDKDERKKLRCTFQYSRCDKVENIRMYWTSEQEAIKLELLY